MVTMRATAMVRVEVVMARLVTAMARVEAVMAWEAMVSEVMARPRQTMRARAMAQLRAKRDLAQMRARDWSLQEVVR